MHWLITILGLSSLSQINFSAAAPACYDKGIADYGPIIHKAMEITDSGTHRQIVDDYADSNGLTRKEAVDKFEPTGILNCKGSTGSANLVLKNDLILASGHSLVDWVTCEVASTPQQCTFKIEGRPPVRIAGVAGSGSKCPQKGQYEGDWVLLKLEHPIDGVKPYKVKPMGSRDTVELQKVVAVGAISADFRRVDPRTRATTYPKHVQNCAIKRIFYRYNPFGLGMDCDASFGSSGGALLNADLSEPTLVGIIAGSTVTKKEGERELKLGIPTRKKYDQDHWHSGGLAVFGDLYDALIKAAL